MRHPERMASARWVRASSAAPTPAAREPLPVALFAIVGVALAAGCTLLTDPDEYAATDDGVVTVCDRYCDAVTDNCVGEHQVFGDWDVCYAFCEDLPVGQEIDTSGNTAHCRLYHATVAGESTPEVHCQHASQDGGGECVNAVAKPVCADYCGNLADKCRGAFAELAGDVADQVAECIRLCNALPDGEPGAVYGDTWQCRVTFADEIIEGVDVAPVRFCPLALPLPDRYGCNDHEGAPCESLCLVYDEYCDSGPWASEEDCLAGCPQMRTDFGEQAVQCVTEKILFESMCDGAVAACMTGN